MILFYHSGTGNSFKAAQWMKEFASDKGTTCELFSIDRFKDKLLPDCSREKLIGFHYPTHGFNASPAILKFLWSFPRSQSGQQVYLMNSRAGGKFFNWHTPGLSGIALYLPMILLWLKGYSIIGARSVDLPSNWISLHPGYGPKWTQSLISYNKERISLFASKILEGKKTTIAAWLSFPIDILIAPVAVLYFVLGRFFLAKTFIYTASCNDCMLCMDNCPVGAISIKSGKPYWSHNCESCMRCISICPQKSIQSSHLIFFGVIALVQLPFSNWISDLISLDYHIDHSILIFLIDNLIVLSLLLSGYFFIQKFLKFKLFSKLFEWTSLTSYWRGYRFPGVGIKEFKQNSLPSKPNSKE